ncbi:hypothetical protein [Nocardia sp. CS682]|uniref:F0F1 ATP synthase subunit B family protein n=1 Tax=Nocardia sp. CS682 TaxID=1047172 RepID=UPI001074A232|nr:hypothetical protein [Nocardia sp. CS682]QBS40696.1 hypothetical protein DMB37_11765 [Nocardia sp. CS682]
MTPSSDILAEGIYQIHFEWQVFVSQLFGFAVIVWVIVKYVAPPVKRMMTKAQGEIQKQIEENQQAADRLVKAKKVYDEGLAEAKAELAQLLEDAHADAEDIVVKMRETAAAEVERVRKQGRDQIELMRRQLIRDLKADFSQQVLMHTSDSVRDQVQSPQIKSDAVERFLDDLETMANTGSSGRAHTQSQWN